MRIRPSWFVIRITAIASLGGILFGYDMGSIAGALPQIQELLALDESRSEWIVSTLYVGACFGALVGGPLCDSFGRRRTILLTDVVFIIGAACLFLSTTYEHIILGRFIVGTAVAVSGIADVSYLHEISRPETRGAVVSVNEACISLGFLLAYVAGSVYRSAEDQEWRLIFGWAGVLALVQFFGMINLPESPVWLSIKGRKEESRAAQKMIHASYTDATQHIMERPHSGAIGSFVDHERIDSDGMEYHQTIYGSNSSLQSRWECITQFMKTYRKQVIISLFLSTTQQFCGQASVINYAPYIFTRTSSYGENGSVHLQTLVIGCVKFAVTILVILRIEQSGRRALLLAGMTLISIGQFALAVAFSGSGSNPIFSLLGAMLVVCGYSMSFGPLQWLLTSELFPTEFRARALGMGSIVTYISAAIVTNTFLSALVTFGPSATFGAYCLFNSAGILFSFLAIPETGGKTVEQIELSLREMWWWRPKVSALH